MSLLLLCGTYNSLHIIFIFSALNNIYVNAYIKNIDNYNYSVSVKRRTALYDGIIYNYHIISLHYFTHIQNL